MAALRAANRAVEDDSGSSVEKVEKNAGVAREWAWLGPTSMVRLGGSYRRRS